MSKLTRTRGWLAVLGLIPLVTLASGVPSVQSSTSDGCSIDTMLAMPGVGVELAPAPDATAAFVADKFESTFATAEVEGSSTSTISAPGVPIIDGHTAVVILFSDPTVTPAGLPAGSETELYAIGCALAFYDARTGDYLATVKRLDLVSP